MGTSLAQDTTVITNKHPALYIYFSLLTLLLIEGDSGGLSFGAALALIALVLLLSDLLVNVDRRLCIGAMSRKK